MHHKIFFKKNTIENNILAIQNVRVCCLDCTFIILLVKLIKRRKPEQRTRFKGNDIIINLEQNKRKQNERRRLW